MFHLVGGCACSCTELGGRLLRRLVFLCSSLCLTVYRHDPQSQPLIEKKIKYFSGIPLVPTASQTPTHCQKTRPKRTQNNRGGEFFQSPNTFSRLETTAERPRKYPSPLFSRIEASTTYHTYKNPKKIKPSFSQTLMYRLLVY